MFFINIRSITTINVTNGNFIFFKLCIFFIFYAVSLIFFIFIIYTQHSVFNLSILSFIFLQKKWHLLRMHLVIYYFLVFLVFCLFLKEPFFSNTLIFGYKPVFTTVSFYDYLFFCSFYFYFNQLLFIFELKIICIGSVTLFIDVFDGVLSYLFFAQEWVYFIIGFVVFFCVFLFFKNFYNWLKFTTITPSFYFKNRLFLEKSFRSNNIYVFLGETHKSFSWLQRSSTNLSFFWIRINRKRLLFFFFLFLFFIFIFFINVNTLSVFTNTFAVKTFFYCCWRFWDWLFVFLLQLQFLILTVFLTIIFSISNYVLLTDLSLLRWMQKHHAEIAPVYEKILKKPLKPRFKNKSDFFEIFNDENQPPFNNLQLLFDNNPKWKNIIELFNDNRINIRNLDKFYIIKSFFKLIGSLPYTENNKLTTNERLSLLVLKKKVLPQISTDGFNLDRLTSEFNCSSIWFTNEPLNVNCLNNFFFLPNFVIEKNFYKTIKTLRYLSLNAPIGRTDLINTEFFFKNILNNTRLDVINLFHSLEWLFFRNIFNTQQGNINSNLLTTPVRLIIQTKPLNFQKNTRLIALRKLGFSFFNKNDKCFFIRSYTQNQPTIVNTLSSVWDLTLLSNTFFFNPGVKLYSFFVIHRQTKKKTYLKRLF